jgi:hypothetical protein
MLAAIGAFDVGVLMGWVASIALTGWMARKKGRGIVRWSLLAILIALWAFVIVALLPSKRQAVPSADGDVDRFAELRDLHDSGVLTDEEFEAKKAKVLTHV